MPSLARTVNVPTRAGSPPPSWPAKDPADVLDFTLNAAAWLAESGHTLLDCQPYADPTLSASGAVLTGPGNTKTAVTVTIAGGVNGSVPIIPMLLKLDGGNQLMMPVRLPVQSRLPGRLVTSGTGSAAASAIDAEISALELANLANSQAIAAEIAARELAGYLTSSQVGGIIDAAITRALAGYVTVTSVNTAIAAGQEFVFEQPVPSALWTIVHNMGRRPAVTITSTADEIVDGDVRYPNLNTVTAQFSAPFAGTAYLT